MDKKSMDKLDDIGFLGTQNKTSTFGHERAMKKTGEFIKSHKAAQAKKNKVRKAS